MELKGTKGFAAYQTYISIIAFLPMCGKYGVDEFLKPTKTDKEKFEIDLDLVLSDFKSLEDDEKKRLILEALQVNILLDQQVVNLLQVHKDANGAPISPRSIGNYSAAEIMKMILETCVVCSYVDTELFF